ncbi:hypothetical protein THAOC_00326 [Thalassiosira oceanica]|uniref:Uncharacterized protein n=1 Tax=Thalassiosira oceanica TaxID=159749 RepID=K0TGF8_THAOC|nr:hypothetical protein THAOC_00326 [Thalassiosira oceanica]|eukprot:EJK77818.1 hypothetical protein THAOC_00326 [Thalassiosira oceanica]
MQQPTPQHRLMSIGIHLHISHISQPTGSQCNIFSIPIDTFNAHMNADSAAESAQLSAAGGPDPEVRKNNRAGNAPGARSLGHWSQSQPAAQPTAAAEFGNKDTEQRHTAFFAPRDLTQEEQPYWDRAGGSVTGVRKETRDGVKYFYVCKDVLTWAPVLRRKRAARKAALRQAKYLRPAPALPVPGVAGTRLDRLAPRSPPTSRRCQPSASNRRASTPPKPQSSCRPSSPRLFSQPRRHCACLLPSGPSSSHRALALRGLGSVQVAQLSVHRSGLSLPNTGPSDTYVLMASGQIKQAINKTILLFDVGPDWRLALTLTPAKSSTTKTWHWPITSPPSSLSPTPDTSPSFTQATKG